MHLARFLIFLGGTRLQQFAQTYFPWTDQNITEPDRCVHLTCKQVSLPCRNTTTTTTAKCPPGQVDSSTRSAQNTTRGLAVDNNLLALPYIYLLYLDYAQRIDLLSIQASRISNNLVTLISVEDPPSRRPTLAFFTGLIQIATFFLAYSAGLLLTPIDYYKHRSNTSGNQHNWSTTLAYSAMSLLLGFLLSATWTDHHIPKFTSLQGDLQLAFSWRVAPLYFSCDRLCNTSLWFFRHYHCFHHQRNTIRPVGHCTHNRAGRKTGLDCSSSRASTIPHLESEPGPKSGLSTKATWTTRHTLQSILFLLCLCGWVLMTLPDQWKGGEGCSGISWTGTGADFDAAALVTLLQAKSHDKALQIGYGLWTHSHWGSKKKLQTSD